MLFRSQPRASACSPRCVEMEASALYTLAAKHGRRALATVRSLEGGRGATCTASGHSAQLLALFPLLAPGDEFVSSRRLYGGSITQFTRTFQKFGWKGVLVDSDDVENVKKAITPRTKAVFCESLANPGGVVVDIEPHRARTPAVNPRVRFLSRVRKRSVATIPQQRACPIAGHIQILKPIAVEVPQGAALAVS